MERPSPTWIALGWDLLVVVIFVVVGRDTHGEANAALDVLRTASPFLLGLAVAYAAAAMRSVDVRAPLGGAGVAAVTTAVGMVVRRVVFGDGVAVTFVVVTVLMLAAAMVGWRVIALVSRRAVSDAR